MSNVVAEKQKDLEFELEQTVQSWVNRTFNFIQLEVVEVWAQSQQTDLSECILHLSPSESFIDWFDEVDDRDMIEEFINTHDGIENSYDDYDLTVGMTKKSAFIDVFGEAAWDNFYAWALETYSMEIDDYISEQENYPMWNTLFEFRSEWFNAPEAIAHCQSIGLGVIHGLEPFNTTLFMTSGGHSYFGSYWIPLYLELHPEEAVKYKGVKFNHL